MKKFLIPFLVSTLVFPVMNVNAEFGNTDKTYLSGKNFFSVNDSCINIEVPENNDSSNNLISAVFVSGCERLETINIPKGVEYIEITGCPSLKEIKIDEENQNYCSLDGILYDKNSETLLLYPSAKDEKTAVFPKGLKTIGSESCMNSLFETAVLPESLTTIEEYAFKGNTNLKSIIIPETVTDNMPYVFKDCENLREITFLNDRYRPDVFSAFGDEFSNMYNDSLHGCNSEQIIIYVPDDVLWYYRETINTYDNSVIHMPLSMKRDDGFLPCDLNNDGIISIADVLNLQKCLFGHSEEDLVGTDINRDGFTDVFDMVLMRQIVTNNYPHNPFI